MGKKREALLEKIVGMQEAEIERLEKGERDTASVHDVTLIMPPMVNLLGKTSWNRASVETVKRMLEEHYDNKLNIYDYWGIGDEREIMLGGNLNQAVKMVLTDKARYRMFPDGIKNDPVFCAFCVDQKNTLTNCNRYVNKNSENDGGWMACDLRKWLNGEYALKALPKEYREIFKEFELEAEKNIFERFALRSEMELFGKTIYGEDHGGRQIEWYKQTRNRIKLDGNDSAESRWYWERSPLSGDSYCFCYVGTDGSAYGDNASDTGGIAPFGCI